MHVIASGFILKSILSWLAMGNGQSDRLMRLEKSRPHRVIAVPIAGILAILSVLTLINATWVPTDMQSYMNSRPDIYQLPPGSFTFITSGLVDADCSLLDDCKEVLSNPFLLKEMDLAEIDKIRAVGSSDLTLYLRTRVATWALTLLKSEPNIVISLPMFRFHEAEMFVGHQHIDSFKRDERLYVTIDAEQISGKESFDIHTVMRLKPSNRPIAGIRNNEGLFVASPTEFQNYLNFQSVTSASVIGKMGQIAKIVLALLCLLLLLCVDRSPESIGLALFMGFEALAIGIEGEWLPVLWGYERVLTNFCYQMGDILKLFFLLQLARVGSPEAKPWLIGGAILSFPYGFFMEFAYETNLPWAFQIPRARDTLVGGLGCLACLNAIISLRGKKVPWRVMALTIGATAALSEVVNSWMAHSDAMKIYPWVKTTFSIFQANTGFLFTLSAFLNISNLKNRVKQLTVERDSAIEMKRKLELEQSVQKSIVQIPQLPDEVGLASHHESTSRVSGDTYFVHYDKFRKSITFMLNDVSGQGVPAALKAFACSMIAKMVWLQQEESQADEKVINPHSRLARFDKLVNEFVCQPTDDALPDFNAMIGAEFFMETQILSLYRANYSFPIVIEPNPTENHSSQYDDGLTWSVRSLIVANREVVNIKLKPGSFVILVSDGCVSKARDESALIRHLHQSIHNFGGRIDAKKMRAAVINWMDVNSPLKLVDDRTILVFQWGADSVISSHFQTQDGLKTA